MKRRLWMVSLVVMLGFVTVWVVAQSQNITVSILAVNDFHGNLAPQNFSIPDSSDRTKRVTVQSGGIETLASIVKQAKAANPNTIFVGGGDLVGASPLVSALLADEPTIMAMNRMGMVTSVIGNHEFDKGAKELQRLQAGGCQNAFDSSKACKIAANYEGAKFQYIAANVVDKAAGKTLFPPYFVQKVAGIDIAFVGAVLKETPTIVVPSGVAGLEFTDEAESINKLIPELKAKGIETIIALIHQGGSSRELFDEVDCQSLSGSIVDIVKKLDKAVDAVITGHTHRGYQCRVDGRLVTQGDAFGRLVTQIDLTINPQTKDVVSAKSANIVADVSKFPKDPEMTALLTSAKALSDPIANQPIAKIATDQIKRDNTPAGESFLGGVIADSQLFATKDAAKGGAVIAFMNPGGIRADLPPNPSASNSVTFGDTFTVQPFGNSLVVMTLTGAQIKTLLESQFDNPEPGRNRIMQVSEGFSYTWDAKAAKGSKVSAIKLNGQDINPTANYRVTVNSFMADGGDNYLVLREGTNRLGGEVDLDALQAYLKAMETAGKPVGPTQRNRITVVNP